MVWSGCIFTFILISVCFWATLNITDLGKLMALSLNSYLTCLFVKLVFIGCLFYERMALRIVEITGRPGESPALKEM